MTHPDTIFLVQILFVGVMLNVRCGTIMRYVHNEKKKAVLVRLFWRKFHVARSSVTFAIIHACVRPKGACTQNPCIEKDARCCSMPVKIAGEQ